MNGWRGLVTGGYSGRRLLLGAIVGIAVGFATEDLLRLPFRFAAGWVAAVAVFLLLTVAALGRATPEDVRRRARRLDSRRWVILALVVAAAAISLLALGASFGKAANETGGALTLRLTLAALTILASWLLTHSIYALHYLHHFYGDDPATKSAEDRGGLAFPGKGLPDYWDFLYFSAVIGMTCQVSDVQVTSRSMRRMVMIHGVLSFFFNTFILALAVNFVAGSLG